MYFRIPKNQNNPDTLFSCLNFSFYVDDLSKWNLCLYLDFVCNTHMNLYNKSFLCIILVDWHHSGINSNLSLLFFLFFFGKMYLWLFFGFCRFCGWFIIFWEGCLCCSLFGDIQGFKPLTFATEFSGIA